MFIHHSFHDLTTDIPLFYILVKISLEIDVDAECTKVRTEVDGALVMAAKSIGNKRIELLLKPVTGRLKLNVLTTALGMPPRLGTFAAFAACSNGSAWDDEQLLH